jgi:alpha-glucosidase
VTNFGPGAVPLPPVTVVVASAPLEGGLLPADTTAWVIPGASQGRQLAPAARTGPRR